VKIAAYAQNWEAQTGVKEISAYQVLAMAGVVHDMLKRLGAGSISISPPGI